MVEGGDWDFVSISLVMVALFGSLSLAFYGVQTQNVELALIGTLYAVVTGVGVWLTEGRLLQGAPEMSLAAVSLIALSYWTARMLFHLLGSLRQGSFTFFSAPTQSYLSFVGQAPFDVQVYVNQALAAPVENSAMIGGAALVVAALMSMGIPAVIAFVVGAGIFSVAFAFLHGAVSAGFLIVATIVMMIMMAMTVGADIGLFSGAVIGALSTFPASVGVHQGNNIEAGGGVFVYYDTLWNAQNLGFAGKAQVLVELLLLVLAVYGVYILLTRGLDALPQR